MRRYLYLVFGATALVSGRLRAQDTTSQASARGAARAIIMHETRFGRSAEYADRAALRSEIRCDTVPFKHVAQDTALRRLFSGHPNFVCGFADSTVRYVFAVERARLQGDTAKVTVRILNRTSVHGIVESVRTYVLLFTDGHWRKLFEHEVSLTPR
jgi:hypothetical protein